MATVDLYVAGFTYTNNPAGTGGSEYRASISGSEEDVVYYQVDESIVHEAVFGETIRKAYLGANERSTLDDQGVTYRTEHDTKNAGMGNYVLWLKPEKKEKERK